MNFLKKIKNQPFKMDDGIASVIDPTRSMGGLFKPLTIQEFNKQQADIRREQQAINSEMLESSFEVTFPNFDSNESPTNTDVVNPTENSPSTTPSPKLKAYNKIKDARLKSRATNRLRRNDKKEDGSTKEEYSSRKDTRKKKKDEIKKAKIERDKALKENIEKKQLTNNNKKK